MPDGKELRDYRIFQDLVDHELEALAPLAREEARDAGARIITEGDLAIHLYLVKEGKLAVKMTGASGQEVLLDEAGVGMSAGWSALSDSRISTASVDVVEPATLIVFDGEALRRLFEADSGIGYRVMKGVNRMVSRRLDRARTRFAAWQ